MKVVKLIYLADRYHLRKYGRPIIGDKYWAMRWGPVGSQILNIANISSKDLDSNCLKYVRGYLAGGDKKNNTVVAKKDVDLDVFSQSDIEALETVYKEFGDLDQFELAYLTHEYPEWAKYKSEIEQGKRRVKMEYEDFFSNPHKVQSDIFSMPSGQLKLVKDIFEENKEVMDLLS